MAYKAPVWEDGNSPAISAEHLNDISRTLEGAQVLWGNDPPTSATEGAVGQFYLVVIADSNGHFPLYQCVGISSTAYNWKPFEFASKYVSSAVASLLGLGTGATVEDALLVLGTPSAGSGILRVSCVDSDGKAVSGCVVQVGSTWGISTTTGSVTFELGAGDYSVSVLSPIDYGMKSQTFNVNIPLSESVTLTATIVDSLSGATELRVTNSVTRAAFSSRVITADVFCVGGGGSGGAVRRYPNNDKTATAAGGAGGYARMATNIDIDLPLTLTVGSGGSAVAAANAQEAVASGNSGGTTKVVDMLGRTILSAAGGAGGTGTYGNGVKGAAGGSGSGGAYLLSSTSTFYVGASGQDGASGGQAYSSSYAGGAGQGTTTRLWQQSGGELFSSAGGSAIASVDTHGEKTGTAGTGAGAAYAMNNPNSIGDLSAGSATTYGSGGGGIAVLDDASSGAYSSGAGKQGLIVFRWEVSA